MKKTISIIILYLGFGLLSSTATAQENEQPDNSTSNVQSTKKKTDRTPTIPSDEYAILQRKITQGAASLGDVHLALTERKDIAALTNTIHALYSMRWHRTVLKLLDDLWALNQTGNPELSWELFAKAPTRIALASTINRIKIFNTQEYKQYIRSHKDDKHEFHRAQVAISLGLNADPVDVPVLKKMADEDNIYVSQSAITSLAIMNANQARNAMIELWEDDKESARGELLLQLLYKAYKWTPLSAAAESGKK